MGSKTIYKDAQVRSLGGKLYSVSEDAKLIFDQKNGIMIAKDGSGNEILRISAEGLYVKDTGGDNRLWINFGNNRLKMNDDTDDRVLIDGDSGLMRVSKSGEDVDVPGTDGGNLVMSSEWDNLRVVSTGTATIPDSSPANFSEVAVNHNLGYVPFCFASLRDTIMSDYYVLPYFYGINPTTSRFWVKYVDSTQVVFRHEVNAGGAGGGSIRYYLLRQTIS